jgi:ParB-like nuclease domain
MSTTDDKPSPYQFMPRLSESEYAALEADIREHGVEVPVVVDEFDNVIDGYHRAEIAHHVGIDCPKDVRVGLTEEEKRRLALKLNLNRRHLDSAGKRAVIAESLKLDPQLSDREHARRCGVSHPTATSVRAGLEQSGDVEKTSTRVDSVGRQQPSSKPPASPPPPAPPVNLSSGHDVGNPPTPVDLDDEDADGDDDGGLAIVAGLPAPAPSVPPEPKKRATRDQQTRADLQYQVENRDKQIEALKLELAERDEKIMELREEVKDQVFHIVSFLDRELEQARARENRLRQELAKLRPHPAKPSTTKAKRSSPLTDQCLAALDGHPEGLSAGEVAMALWPQNAEQSVKGPRRMVPRQTDQHKVRKRLEDLAGQDKVVKGAASPGSKGPGGNPRPPHRDMPQTIYTLVACSGKK